MPQKIPDRRKNCRDCIYAGSAGKYPTCEYILHTRRPRPCPAGEGCTVKKTILEETDMPKATWDKDRALALFQEGADDLTIAEAVGATKDAIRVWRGREHLRRVSKKKPVPAVHETVETSGAVDVAPDEAADPLPHTLTITLAALADALFNFEDSIMDLIRESFHRRNAAIRERCLLIMEILSGVYEHIEKMQKENAAPSAATPESGKD